MGKVISLVSIKGGVGKTTLSSALATELANKHGLKVLLIDTNYSAPNLGLHMNVISPKKTIHDVLSGGVNMKDAIHYCYGVDVVPGNFMFKRSFSALKLKNKLSSLKSKYDFVILDTSPNMNDELLSAIMASDALFMVSTADYPTLSCSMKTARNAKERGKPVTGIILNRVKGKYQISLQEIQGTVGIPVVANIKEDDINRMALHERIPATLFARDTVFSKEVAKFANSLIGIKERRGLNSLVFGLKKEQVNREVLRQNFYKSMFK